MSIPTAPIVAQPPVTLQASNTGWRQVSRNTSGGGWRIYDRRGMVVALLVGANTIVLGTSSDLISNDRENPNAS